MEPDDRIDLSPLDPGGWENGEVTVTIAAGKETAAPPLTRRRRLDSRLR